MPAVIARTCGFQTLGAVSGVRRLHRQLPVPPPSALARRNLQDVRCSSSSTAEHQTSLAASHESPYLEPFLRTFILGTGAGVLLEASHVALQVLTGSFPGISQFSPLLVTDHMVGLAAWVCLYAIEASGITRVLQRCNFDQQAAAPELQGLTTLPRSMLPSRLNLLRQLVLAGTRLRRCAAKPAVAAGAAAAAAPAPAPQQVPPKPSSGPLPRTGQGNIVPAPGLLRPRPTGAPETLPSPEPSGDPGLGSSVAAKRQKELQDRASYLTNFWYAAALSERVKDAPVKVELCGKEMVLFRGKDGRVRCVDNACPHRGAPLSDGWVSEHEGHNCIVCPYHGWSFDEQGALRDVPAAASKGEWPRRPLVDAYDVEEKGGFVWVFFGSRQLPAEERPPIPHVPELDHPDWKAVYEEMEFDCPHFGVFENAFDFAHIHYLHADSFGNQGKPEVRDVACTTDQWGVSASFTIHNKPVNAFWALFQVPAVHVTARAFLPSTSMVTFTLGAGLSFTTFVNTVPISATRSVNRFALTRHLAWDKSGLFNARLWDGMARDAMLKILGEDKAMVEQLKYTQLPAEYSVGADRPQVAFRKLRQQYVDLGYAVPPENVLPPFANSVARGQPRRSCSGGSKSTAGAGASAGAGRAE